MAPSRDFGAERSGLADTMIEARTRPEAAGLWVEVTNSPATMTPTAATAMTRKFLRPLLRPVCDGAGR